MDSRFLEPGSPAWDEFLSETTHDFYHRSQYVRLSAQDRLCAPDANGEPRAFLAQDDYGNQFFAAMVFRPVPQQETHADWLFDGISPYGYAAPLINHRGGPSVEQFTIDAINAFKHGLRDSGIVSAFFRLHPLIPFPIEALNSTGCLKQHGQTVHIDLTLPTDELWHQTRAGHRSEINRARRNGFTVVIDENWSAFDDFYRAYTSTMHRVGASDGYFFSRDYFGELRAALGDSLHLAICRKGDDVACGGLFTESCGIVQYHLSGTIDEFHSQYPTKVMLDSVRTWAKERGNRVMHLGGGFGGSEDSLFAFKAGFSHLRSPFYTWRVIADEQNYATLCHRWEARAGRPASAIDGFFPAYRAPVVQSAS